MSLNVLADLNFLVLGSLISTLRLGKAFSPFVPAA